MLGGWQSHKHGNCHKIERDIENLISSQPATIKFMLRHKGHSPIIGNEIVGVATEDDVSCHTNMRASNVKNSHSRETEEKGMLVG